jgi:hypothetical protein
MSRLVGVVVVIAGFLGIVYLEYGTIEPCGVLANQIARDFAKSNPTTAEMSPGAKLGNNLGNALAVPFIRYMALGSKSPGECLQMVVFGYRLGEPK